MEITFKKSQINSFADKITGYKNLNYKYKQTEQEIKFIYLDPKVESYMRMRLMHGEGVISNGYTVFIKLTYAAYTTNHVPLTVTGSGLYSDDVYVRQKLWSEWQPISMQSNDDSEVILNTTVHSKAATLNDLNILEDNLDVLELMGQGGYVDAYKNNVDWLKDENGDPVTESPIDKTALYYTNNWESESFDFIHAQRIVDAWFSTLPGASYTAKFNAANDYDKREIIRWGILPRTAECNSIIEDNSLNNNYSASLRLWNTRRAYAARNERFETAFSYLVDNVNETAIWKLDSMLTYEMKQFYIHYGSSTQANRLIINNQLSQTFRDTFVESDLSYSNMTIEAVMDTVETILIADRFVSQFV